MALKRDLAKEVFAQTKRQQVQRSGLDDRVQRQRQRLRADLFPQQLALMDDPWRFKAVLCSRRAGKSFTAQAMLLDRALAKPGAACVFITMTRGKAKRLLWSILHKQNNKLDLGIQFNHAELTATFPNGSIITLAGAETAADIEKFRGEAFDLVVVDECKSFPTSLLDEMLADVLSPALADHLGTLVMMGTPGAILTGTFFQATGPEACQVSTVDGVRKALSRRYDDRNDPRLAGVEFGWSLHSWSTKDNVKKPHIWQEALNNKLRAGWSDEDPTWLREWMGQWVADNSAFVLRYTSERNAWTPNPEWADTHGLDPQHEWHFVLGMDLGYDDDFDIEVFAWAPTVEAMYHVAGFNAPRLEVKDIALKVVELQEQFGTFDVMVGDRGGLGKMILATLDSQYGLFIEAADKQEKRDYIELLNSDLVNRKLFFLSGSNLETQALTAQWDETGKKVDDSTPDHAIDASLYVWRYCYHHFAKQRMRMPEQGTPEARRLQILAEMEALSAERKRRRGLDFTEAEAERVALDDFAPQGVPWWADEGHAWEN